MIKKNGKAYVVLEFDDEADAAYFEISFNDRARDDLLESCQTAMIRDDAFASEDEVNAIDSIDRLAGKRVQ